MIYAVGPAIGVFVKMVENKVLVELKDQTRVWVGSDSKINLRAGDQVFSGDWDTVDQVTSLGVEITCEGAECLIPWTDIRDVRLIETDFEKGLKAQAGALLPLIRRAIEEGARL